MPGLKEDKCKDNFMLTFVLRPCIEKYRQYIRQGASVGKDIVRMTGMPVFSSSFKRKDKTKTLGNSSAVKAAPDRTTDSSLLFQRFLVVARTRDLSLEEVMIYKSIPAILF